MPGEPSRKIPIKVVKGQEPVCPQCGELDDPARRIHSTLGEYLYVCRQNHHWHYAYGTTARMLDRSAVDFHDPIDGIPAWRPIADFWRRVEA